MEHEVPEEDGWKRRSKRLVERLEKAEKEAAFWRKAAERRGPIMKKGHVSVSSGEYDRLIRMQPTFWDLIRQKLRRTK